MQARAGRDIPTLRRKRQRQPMAYTTAAAEQSPDAVGLGHVPTRPCEISRSPGVEYVGPTSAVRVEQNESGAGVDDGTGHTAATRRNAGMSIMRRDFIGGDP